MTTLVDPVCGMEVSEPALRVEGYESIAFCAESCRRAFVADPTRYTHVTTEGVGSVASTGAAHDCGCDQHEHADHNADGGSCGCGGGQHGRHQHSGWQVTL